LIDGWFQSFLLQTARVTKVFIFLFETATQLQFTINLVETTIRNRKMNNDTSSSLTQILNRWRDGDASAFDRVQKEVMHDLTKMAESRMRGEDNATITPADLLNEALLVIMEQGFHSADRETASALTTPVDEVMWKNRAHFFATISLHMRTILVDRARARRADKRGGGAVHVTLSHALNAEESVIADLIALDEALTQFALIDARGAEILHLTYFAGLTREEIATLIDLSVPTVDRELRFARAWLSDRLGSEIG
jgi:RNA polymerase sigma factor (TIGR02999 family)